MREVKPFLPPDKHPSMGLTPTPLTASRFSETITIPWICSQQQQAEDEAERRRAKVEPVASALQFKLILPENRSEMNSTQSLLLMTSNISQQ